jgi:hypothetical protein
MEDRRLMAGDMAAFMHNGALIIQEAAGSVGGASAIQLTNYQGGGTIRVRGVTNLDGTVTRIGDATSANFKTYRDFVVGSGPIFITTGNGNDVIEVMPSTVIRGDLNINTSNSGAAYNNDHDQIYLDHMLPLKSVTINTGTGDDFIDIDTLYRTVSNQRLDINTGFGNDTVRMLGHISYFDSTGANQGYIRIQTYADVNNAAFDNDTVNVQDSTALNLGILTGGGNDTVAVGNTLTPRVTVYTHGGNDSLSFNNVRAVDAVYANLGDGDDSLSLGYGGVASPAFDAYGGAGFDTLSRPGTLNPGFRIKSGFEREILYRSYYVLNYATATDATFAVL